MPAYVVVQYARTRSRSRRTGKAAATSAFKRLLTEHDAVLLPAPESPGGELGGSGFTTISVPDMARANKLAEALRALDEVETAYAKPGEELP